MNPLAQERCGNFTQWSWIKHPTFQLRGGHFTTELLPLPTIFYYILTAFKVVSLNLTLRFLHF